MITALGISTNENWENLLAGQSGLKMHEDTAFLNEPFCAAMVEAERLENAFEKLKILQPMTRLEKMFTVSINAAAKEAEIDVKSKKTLFIFSTTKGNIDLLQDAQGFSKDRLRLGKMAEAVTAHFNNPNRPIVVSNACISGVVAIIMGSRMLKTGQYDNVVVTGGDLVTNFTLTGFRALRALSPEPCRPFDANRKGINLGEGVGTMILSNSEKNSKNIAVLGGGISNDANHISGPSRTGEGLQLAIKGALGGNILTSKIDYISAHGTATLYNDEMEAKAFHALNLQTAPMNSFKGYFGHTLGAAGILEGIVACKSLIHNELIRSAGFEENGVTMPVGVIEETRKANLTTILKTSSGFGGCNAAVVFRNSLPQ
jgi:3-oxoacyl-[acyl-carrier-protein] synthase-1